MALRSMVIILSSSAILFKKLLFASLATFSFFSAILSFSSSSISLSRANDFACLSSLFISFSASSSIFFAYRNFNASLQASLPP
uniref:Uncharacterized protein n=1 Tax=Zea mays TaxID=4577 RepID=C4IZG0_MAIZE|nr:unknown [Zea mays]